MRNDLLLNIVCPDCRGDLVHDGNNLNCQHCGNIFQIDDGIPIMIPNTYEFHSTTKRIKDFYEKVPFPDYSDFDNKAALINKAKKSIYAKMLDQELPYNAKILEIGCGTGQMTNFLAATGRKVIGSDISLNSLKKAKGFAQKEGITGSDFILMDLFKPAFKNDTFDYVIANGVLHHTYNAEDAFKSISNLVKTGGFIIIGLYHKFGRILNNVRKAIYHISNQKIIIPDHRLKKSKLNKAQKEAWLSDQFSNPKESRYMIYETIKWLQTDRFSFIRSIPSAKLFDSILPDGALFDAGEKPGVIEMLLTEILMIFTNYREGGFFIVIGKKK
jgi:SAM-dependent methyltransferase